MSESQEPRTKQESIARKLQAVASVAAQGRATGDAVRAEKFPRWSAPLIGAVVGAGLAWRFLAKGTMPGGTGATLASAIAVGAILGFAAGLLIWLLDRQTPRPAPTPATLPASDGSQVDVMDAGFPSTPEPELNLVGKLCTLLGIVLCLIPMAGLGMAIPAFIMHRIIGKKLGCLLTGGLVVSALTTLLFFLALAIPALQ